LQQDVFKQQNGRQSCFYKHHHNSRTYKYIDSAQIIPPGYAKS